MEVFPTERPHDPHPHGQESHGGRDARAPDPEAPNPFELNDEEMEARAEEARNEDAEMEVVGFMGSLEPAADDFISELMLQQLGPPAGATSARAEQHADASSRRCILLHAPRQS